MRIFACFLMLWIALGANELEKVVQNLVGESSYRQNQNFIKRLFENPKKFYSTSEKLDFYKITQVLQENGLFDVSFSQPTELQLNFQSHTKPIVLFYALDRTLSEMGYAYLTVSKAQFKDAKVEVSYLIQTDVVVDPVVLLHTLRKHGFAVSYIAREGENQWNYTIKKEREVLAGSIKIKHGDNLDLKRVSGEYWFDVRQVGVLEVMTQNEMIEWIPKVVFYDKDLQVLDVVAQEEFVSGVQIEVFDKVKFVMVTDAKNSSRLKQGVSATFSPNSSQ